MPWDELDFMEHDLWRRTLSYYRHLLGERKIRRDHGVNYLLTRLGEQNTVTIAELREHLSTEERARFFYRRIPDEEFNYFRQFVMKIFSHKIWDDPDPKGEIATCLAKDDATTAKSLFDEKELTVQWVLGA